MRLYAYEDRSGDARFGVLARGGLLTAAQLEKRGGLGSKRSSVFTYADVGYQIRHVDDWLHQVGAATQKALRLHPATLAPTGRGSETVRRILSNLSQVAVGVAELRNEYGPDHGRTQVTVLSPRHAHLAVGCASTYARMLLETLDDPGAPWRRSTS